MTNNNHKPIRTAVYVDGFNLYYWLKRLPYRWIDLKALALVAIASQGRSYEVVAVKYFTARVSDTYEDRTKSTRQDIYFQALTAQIPELMICKGEFRRKPRQMPRSFANGTTGPLVWVMDTEEKGSDVNLAVELVNDAWLDTFDLAVVISNDSDLERALRIAKGRGKTIGALVRGDAEVNSLRRVSNFLVKLNEDHLKASLMPREIPNTKLKIPQEWLEMEQAARVRT